NNILFSKSISWLCMDLIRWFVLTVPFVASNSSRISTSVFIYLRIFESVALYIKERKKTYPKNISTKFQRSHSLNTFALYKEYPLTNKSSAFGNLVPGILSEHN